MQRLDESKVGPQLVQGSPTISSVDSLPLRCLPFKAYGVLYTPANMLCSFLEIAMCDLRSVWVIVAFKRLNPYLCRPPDAFGFSIFGNRANTNPIR